MLESRACLEGVGVTWRIIGDADTAVDANPALFPVICEYFCIACGSSCGEIGAGMEPPVWGRGVIAMLESRACLEGAGETWRTVGGADIAVDAIIVLLPAVCECVCIAGGPI
jgi:hypothetical protein